TWVFNFFFSACIGPLSWAYPAEIYSTRTRAKATAITSSSSWISNFFIAQVTPYAFRAVGWRVVDEFGFRFGICGSESYKCGVHLVILPCKLPPNPPLSQGSASVTNLKETTGRRLEEMDALFEKAPIFIPTSPYAKTGDRYAAEKEMRQGNFVPGNLTEDAGFGQGVDEEVVVDDYDTKQ
ncbi:mfs sugar, partial [Moniliophthora roreri]